LNLSLQTNAPLFFFFLISLHFFLLLIFFLLVHPNTEQRESERLGERERFMDEGERL